MLIRLRKNRQRIKIPGGIVLALRQLGRHSIQLLVDDTGPGPGGDRGRGGRQLFRRKVRP